MPTVDCGSSQDDCQHGFTDAGRSDEQHVGRVGEVGACYEFPNEFLGGFAKVWEGRARGSLNRGRGPAVIGE